MAEYLVTGGSGFLGTLLVTKLLQDGHQVTSIDLLPTTLEHPRLNAVVGDIRDRAALDAIYAASRPDAVFHCAALLAHGSITEAELMSHNAHGTRVLAEATADAGVRKLPPAHMFATIDRGPEILVRTHHTAVVGGYHRNQKKMIEVLMAFSGPIDQARAIIKANHADYVIACTGSPDLAAYANFGKDNLADRIFEKRVPDWLQPVPGFATGNLRLYRVR